MTIDINTSLGYGVRYPDDPSVNSMIIDKKRPSVSSNVQIVWNKDAWTKGMFRQLKLSVIREQLPSEYSVCLDLLAKDERCKLPRGMEAKIHRIWEATHITAEDLDLSIKG